MEHSNIIIYQTENGQTKIETRLEDETVWLTQAQLAELFQKSRVTITEHIGNIFKEGELERKFSMSEIPTYCRRRKKSTIRLFTI